MPLTPGTRLGPYEILAPLGAGGMGEVYRGTDTDLKRQVAIKVLPIALAGDADRLARFQREAEVLAALNHPNIAHIHGLEKADGTIALVMELVEGPTLADRIAKGAIPLGEALPIAKQIAEALEAAHEQGIVHRDLKPANIKVRDDGTVKVLDFGLAKAMDRSGASSASPMNSPTISVHATQAGVILGTAAYMSPEQARGTAVDHRADIWAFGVVLFEMLTGQRGFEGQTISDTLASVLKIDPRWNALPADVTLPIRRLIHRCLEKDPKRRLQAIGEARCQIEDVLNGAPEDTAVTAISSTQPVWQRGLPWALLASSLVALAVVLSLRAPWRKAAPPGPLRLDVGLGAEASLWINGEVGSGPASVLSPDGQTLAFVAQKSTSGLSQVYVRHLDQLEAIPMLGSDGAGSPFFSPDGQWIAFFAGGKLKKISVAGGAAVTLCNAPGPRGGVWADDGTIVFQPIGASGAPLMRVSSAGGKPEPLLSLAEGEATQRWPQVLPGGKAVLFTSNSSTGAGYQNATVVVQRLPNGPRTILRRGGYYGRYLPSGHLVYISDDTLFAAPFDLGRLELVGQPVPPIAGITNSVGNGGGQFAVSGTGTVVYLPGPSAYLPGQSAMASAPIHWMDHTGTATPLREKVADWNNPHFSPDGRHLAMDINTGGTGVDVWVYEWAHDALTRLTFGRGQDRRPVWTPNGRRIVFASDRGDKSTSNLYWQRADGTGDVQRLTDSPNPQYPASWHPSGKFLAFEETNPQTGWDLMILPIEGDESSEWRPGKATAFLNGPANEAEPMFSPDGRWVAYGSNESGPWQVYVRPFPGPGGRWQISTSGGLNPTWSRTRHELFYASDSRIMVAPYTVEGDSFRSEQPRPWSEAQFVQRPDRSLDLHPDGDRFALAAAPVKQAEAKQDHVTLVFNFFDELRRIAPVTKR